MRGPSPGPPTGVTANVEISGIPKDLRLEAPFICYELDLEDGGFGAEARGGPLINPTREPVDIGYDFVVTSGGEVFRFRGEYSIPPSGQQPATDPMLLPFGNYATGKMLEVEKGLKRCQLKLKPLSEN